MLERGADEAKRCRGSGVEEAMLNETKIRDDEAGKKRDERTKPSCSLVLMTITGRCTRGDARRKEATVKAPHISGR